MSKGKMYKEKGRRLKGKVQRKRRQREATEERGKGEEMGEGEERRQLREHSKELAIARGCSPKFSAFK